jgi:hypothetical protein
MIVHVHIDGYDVEKQCEPIKEFGELVVDCRDYDNYHEVTIDEVELERADIEDIVEEYLDDVIDILLKDRRYRDALLKKLDNIKR